MFSQTSLQNLEEADGPGEHLALLVSSEDFLKPGGNAGPIMGLKGEEKKIYIFFKLEKKEVTQPIQTATLNDSISCRKKFE